MVDQFEEELANLVVELYEARSQVVALSYGDGVNIAGLADGLAVMRISCMDAERGRLR